MINMETEQNMVQAITQAATEAVKVATLAVREIEDTTETRRAAHIATRVS